MWCVLGLGNPGKRYAQTRHNIGFMVLDRVAELLRVSLSMQTRFKAEVGKVVDYDPQVLLVKPQTYMNCSGQSVQKVLQYTPCTQEKLIVVYDDVDLPFSRIRVREEGSTGGHNGLRSLCQVLHPKNKYLRVRMGIGKPFGEDLAEYVLRPFSLKEKEQLEEFVEQGAKVVLRLLQAEPSVVMTEVNQKLTPRNKEKLENPEEL